MNFKELIMILCTLAYFLEGVLSSPLPRPCNRRIKPKKAIQRIKEKNYLTVENALVGTNYRIQRNKRDDTSGLIGASPCQWRWGSTPRRPNEIPSSLQQAVCPSCSHYCHPIKYTFRVLATYGCDTKSGLTIWRWKLREITIAYVYK